MITVTNTTYYAMQSNTAFVEEVSATLANGTVLAISASDIIVTGNQISSGAGASAFPVGAAMGRIYNISLSNLDGKYDDYDFYGAKITLVLAYNNGTTTERINYGTYTVITPEAKGDIIQISAADDMYKADVPYVTSLSFPTTAGLALADACQGVGIALQSASFTGSDYQINQKPDCTVRELLGGIALVAGGNAFINFNGRLEIKRYSQSYQWDGTDLYNGAGGLSGRITGCHYLWAWTSPPSIDTDDIVITGLSTGDNDNTFITGSPGYIIKVDNPIIEGNEQDALNKAGAAVIGLRFRRFSGTYIGDPTIEPMDLCIVRDREGNTYRSIVTDVTYNMRGTTEIQNSAEPKIRATSTASSATGSTMQKVKRLIVRNLSAYDVGVQNLTELMSNSLGFYHTVEEQQDGSTVLYLHDKPLLAESEIIYKRTASGYAGSTDGGETWSYGVDNLGNAVMNTVAAKGISFDWARGGSIVITKGNREVFYADADTGDVRINFDTITLAGQDYALDAAIATVIEWALDNFPGVVGNKIETFYQSTDPSLTWSGDSHYGDMWCNTSNNSFWVWGSDPQSVLSEGEWLPLEEPPMQIFDTIRKHRVIYVTSTVSPPYSVGDMWYKDGRTYVAQQNRTVSDTGSDTDWSPIVYREDSTTYNLDNELNSTEEIFNRLTNNGQVRGLFLRDVVVGGQTVKQLYISFDYAEGGTLKLGRGAKNYGNLVVFGGTDAQTGNELQIIEVNDSGITVCTEGKWGIEYFTIAENIITAYSGGNEVFRVDLTAQMGSYIDTSYWAKHAFWWDIDDGAFAKMFLGAAKSEWHNDSFYFADNSGNDMLVLKHTNSQNLIYACADSHSLRSADGLYEWLLVQSGLIEGKTGKYYFWNSAGNDKLLEMSSNGIVMRGYKLETVTNGSVSFQNTVLGYTMSMEPRCGNITIKPRSMYVVDSDNRRYTSVMTLGGMRVLVDTGADHYWELGDTSAVNHQIELRSSRIMFQCYAGVNSSNYSAVMGITPGRVDISGSLYINGSIVNASDRRLKRNITPVEDTGIIEHLKVCSYDWKAGGHSSAGLIAQDVQEVCPELVEDIGGGYLGVNYIGIIPHLIAKVQEQDKVIKKQSEQLKNLEERLIRLERMVNDARSADTV